MNSTTELIKSIQKGDKESFNRLITKYQSYVFRIALKYLKNCEDAEDLTQEVFIKVYQNLESFKFKSDFKTYLYRITVNSSINYYKQKKRIQFNVNSYAGNEDIEDITVNDNFTLDQKLIEEEIISDLESSIKNLSKTYKTIIYLKDFQNMPYKEISKQLKISENAAKIRHHYALKKLKNSFLK